MVKNTNKDFASKDVLQNLIGGFLGKNLDISNENKEKIASLINSLTDEDIKRITELAKSGQLNNLIKKDQTKV